MQMEIATFMPLYIKDEDNVMGNIDWKAWLESVLIDLPGGCSLGDAEIVKKHLEAAVQELTEITGKK